MATDLWSKITNLSKQAKSIGLDVDEKILCPDCGTVEVKEESRLCPECQQAKFDRYADDFPYEEPSELELDNPPDLTWHED